MFFLESQFSEQTLNDAENELRGLANDHYHTKIGWATGFEIIAAILTLLAAGLAFILASASKSDDL